MSDHRSSSTATWQDVSAGADHPSGAIELPHRGARHSGSRVHAFAGVRQSAFPTTLELTISLPPPGR